MVANKENVCIRLRPATTKKLKEIADKKEIRFSELVRLVLENYVQMN